MTAVASSAAAAARAPTPRHNSSNPPNIIINNNSNNRQHAEGAAPTASAATAATAAAADRRSNRPAPVDPLSDRATLTLIRRTLCPQPLGDKGRDAPPPIEELLPPLTSRNDVDLQLYAFLAIIMREFVQSWYGRITTDEAFVAEILHIIAHCSRALEQRFRNLDLESLVLDEIPDLLDRHTTAYRASHRPVSQPPIQVDPREIYHSLCPLPFLSPVPRPADPTTISQQSENEAAYRQLLVQAVLAVLLPTEDLENPCLTSLVGQIFSELIIGNVIANKASQPWLLYEAICITAGSLKEQKTRATARATARIISGTHQPSTLSQSRETTPKWTVQGFFVLIIHLAILSFTAIRLLVGTVAESFSLPPRTVLDMDHEDGQDLKHPSIHIASAPAKVPVLAFKVWSCFGNLVELQERKPWLGGFLSLLQIAAIGGPLRIAGLNGPLDRLLSRHIQSLFDPSHLPPILRSLRGVLFPNNSPGTSTLAAPSSEKELLALRRRAANAIFTLLPRGVSRVYFGGRLWPSGSSVTDNDEDREGNEDDDDQRIIDELESLLKVVGDEYCNKHLMYNVLELLLVRLMPELSEKGVAELWEERLD